MGTKLFTAISMLLAATALNAQSLGEFKPADQSFGLKQLKKDNINRIFIANFVVNYQVYNEKQDFKQGGSQFGGGERGDAMAEASVGLDGLDAATVQQITDQLYADYLAKLKAKGLTVITADDAAKTETYEDYTRVTGGTASLAQIPGAIATTPTGFQYFIKRTDKNGKEKKGGFLGHSNFLYPSLSKQLNDAIIGNVEMNVLFVKDKNAFKGNGAKIKIKTDLRLVANDAIVMTDNSDSFIKLKGQNTTTAVQSTVAFYQGKKGLGSPVTYVGTLKNDLEINGVIDETTVTSFARGSVDQGTSTIYGTFYSVRNANNAEAKIIRVDAAKYRKGVYDAAKKFLDHHTDEFLQSFWVC